MQPKPRSSCAASSVLGLALLLLLLGSACTASASNARRRGREDKTNCPKVKAMRNFEISKFLGGWYVVQYYASSEEALSYRCMRAELQLSPRASEAQISMNFSYSFVDDPLNEQLLGNISWQVPDFAASPAHWLHAELPYEGVYNTYVLDSDYESWALLMHCAEKAGSPRYLSSLIMSRQPSLQTNVVSYLREKLPRYSIDLAYMFPMDQTDCQTLDPFLGQTAREPVLQPRHPFHGKT